MSQAAPASRATLAMTAMELRLALRRGETLVATIVLPVVVLVFFSAVLVIPSGAGRPVDFLLPGSIAFAIIATSLVIAGWFAAEGRRGWAWFYGTGIPILFMALAAVGFAVRVNPVALAFLATPWIWVTVLAVHLKRLAATRGDQVPAGQEMRSAPVAG